ncbi:MAG: CPBP family intramembrane metalloprotease [Micrococcus sp.]|nr:CPBP family intramembrane metalloprotease [Micrococcus sp.]
MKRLYEKNEIRHFLVWLAIYLGLSIVVINLGSALGVGEHEIVALPLAVLAVVMLVYFRRTSIGPEIGLGARAAVSAPRMWFYVPLLVLVCYPLVTGVRNDLTTMAVAALVLHYAASGFLEEVLFRGLLLRALLKEGRPIWAVAISSLTFGIGHIISVLIGQSGQDTVFQIINATIVGLLFTLVVIATQNLTAVIVAHVLYNIIATLSRTGQDAALILPGFVILLVYGTWLLFGVGVLDRLRSPGVKAQPTLR